ncbi:g11219 [Coccomyxa elongata]
MNSKAKLEDELRRRDLDASGTKAELIERLHAALTVFLVEEEAAPAAHLADTDGNRKEAGAPPPSGGMSESDRVSVSLETDNSLAALLDLTKRELQQALVERGLPKTGNKTDLAQRLFSALEDERSVLLAEQMEASAELQRQYQEAAASSGFRRPGVEDSMVGENDEDEEFSKWAAEVDREYEGPEDTAEEDRVGTEMELRETDWRVINGRPGQMMEMFEHQGTAAAELASEDYALHQRAERTTLEAAREDQDDNVTVEDSQDVDDDMNPSITGSRSGRKQQMGPYGEDSDRFDTENELEDGFSFVTDDTDGFDSDAEERLAQLDSTRAHVQGRQAERADEADDMFAPPHRNYQNLSARSPDDFDVDLDEEDEGDGGDMLLDAAGSLARGGLVLDDSAKLQVEEEMVTGNARGAAAVSGAAADSEAESLGRSSPPSPALPPSSNKVSIPGGGKGKGVSLREGRTALTHAGSQDAAAEVVASQGVSTLDNQTALDWMRTRLPEATQLINPGSSLTQPALSAEDGAPAEQVQEMVAEDTTEAAHDSGGGALKQDVPADAIEGEGAETAQSGTHDVIEQEAVAEQTEEEEATEAHGSRVGISEEDIVAFTSTEEEAQTAENFPKQDDTMDQDLPFTVQDSGVGAQMQEALGAQIEAALADALEEDAAKAAEAMEGEDALEAALHPKELPDDGTLLETNMPVRFQGFESAQEDLQTPPAQPEVGAMDNPSEKEQLLEDTTIKEGIGDAAVEEVLQHVTEAQTVIPPHLPDDDSQAVMGVGSVPLEDAALLSDESIPAAAHTADTAGEALEKANAQEAVPSVPTLEHQLLAPASSGDIVQNDMHGSGVQLPHQKEMEALQVEMKQKQDAITALQGKMLAAENAGDDNVARIASLQAALVELQSQQLAWQRDNLSERLAVLLEAASQASLNTSTKDELKSQLEAMRGELTQLEADLSSRDTEAARLSAALADARAKLGGSETRAKLGGAESAPGGPGGVSSGRIPGSIQVKLDMDLGELASTGPSETARSATKLVHPFPSVKPATTRSTAQTNSSRFQLADNKKPSFDAGWVVTAGLVKLVSGLFGLVRKPKKDSKADEQDRNSG